MVHILQIIFISSILLYVILNIKVWKNFGLIRAKLPLFKPYTLNFWAKVSNKKGKEFMWHNFTYVYDGNNKKYYIDGKEASLDEWERFCKPD